MAGYCYFEAACLGLAMSLEFAVAGFVTELKEAHEGEEVLYGLEYHRNDTERHRQALIFGLDLRFHRIMF